MKTEKIEALADFIESIPSKRFNISNWISELMGENYSYYNAAETLDIDICNTAGCIAGWTLALDNGGVIKLPRVKTPDDAKAIALRGAESLGLSLEQAVRLFYVDEGSIWVEYIDMYEEFLDCYGDDDLEWSKEDKDQLAGYLADNDVINNKVAVFMLRQIAKGEVKL